MGKTDEEDDDGDDDDDDDADGDDDDADDDDDAGDDADDENVAPLELAPRSRGTPIVFRRLLSGKVALVGVQVFSSDGRSSWSIAKPG